VAAETVAPVTAQQAVNAPSRPRKEEIPADYCHSCSYRDVLAAQWRNDAAGLRRLATFERMHAAEPCPRREAAKKAADAA
jgi:hypothetical protein